MKTEFLVKDLGYKPTFIVITRHVLLQVTSYTCAHSPLVSEKSRVIPDNHTDMYKSPYSTKGS